ncbi:hypothetical protein KW782_04040 [Candidatus Parcubacteria bacterium]|nr:hypothetical protein [Candidatus Parcubacteria bacterium]
MVENNLFPHPPEPGLISAVKKVPLIKTTRQAQLVLYGVSALFFLASVVIFMASTGNVPGTTYEFPDSLKHLQQ